VECNNDWRLLAPLEHASAQGVQRVAWPVALHVLHCTHCTAAAYQVGLHSFFLATLQWLLRHVYYPCMRTGMAKHVAGVVVFLVSALFHELLVGLPLHMLRAWSFIGIMSQVGRPVGFVDALLSSADFHRKATRSNLPVHVSADRQAHFYL
jgi:MBOAT, membrane-bound O-acyltransferase family